MSQENLEIVRRGYAAFHRVVTRTDIFVREEQALEAAGLTG